MVSLVLTVVSWQPLGSEVVFIDRTSSNITALMMLETKLPMVTGREFKMSDSPTFLVGGCRVPHTTQANKLTGR